MKKRDTFTSLVLSMLSIVLSMAMLAGTTFAWFTVSVTSGNNIIVSGNLHVELEYSHDGKSWKTVDANTNVFQDIAEGGKPVTQWKWEPGHTRVVYLRVKNTGSMALKYRLGVYKASETFGMTDTGERLELSRYIKFGVVVDNENGGLLPFDQSEAGRKAARDVVDENAVTVFGGYSSSGEHPLKKEYVLEAQKTSETIALVVYMPENIGQEANPRQNPGDPQPELKLGIRLGATQNTVEVDSFGDDYDTEASNPYQNVIDLSAQGYTVVDANNPIPNNAEKVVLNGDITLSSKNSFSDGAIFDANGYTVTINHLDAIAGKNITIKNGVFEKGSDTWGIATGSATFENCTFNNVSPYITPNAGMNISVKECVFNDTSLQICWGEGEKVDPAKVTTEIIGNTFNYTATGEHDHVIALNAGAYSDFSKVDVSENTFNNKGDKLAFSALYMTTGTAKSIVANYHNNTENNAAVGYRGSDGYGTVVADEEAEYLVFDGDSKVLHRVTADKENYTVPTDVTELGNFVFSSNPAVKKVTVPANVTDLGRGFDSSNVEEVILSEGLETISSRAFRNTPNLKNLVIPSTVTTIVENAFQTSGMEEIVIPASVTSIGDAAFQHCEKLKTVTIEDNPVIANYAFRACASLTDVYLKGADVKFANGISMVFSVAENNNDNSQITIHVVNETVKARVEAVTRGNINIVID